jgi:hypothetical protein
MIDTLPLSPHRRRFGFDAGRGHACACAVDFLRVEARIDRFEALEERRMGREQARHAGREQHVRDLFDLRVAEARASTARTDLDERAAQGSGRA